MHVPDDWKILHFDRQRVVDGIVKSVCSAFGVAYLDPNIAPISTLPVSSTPEPTVPELPATEPSNGSTPITPAPTEPEVIPPVVPPVESVPEMKHVDYVLIVIKLLLYLLSKPFKGGGKT